MTRTARPTASRHVRSLILGLGWDRPGGLNRYVQDLHTALERRGLEPRTLVVGPSRTAPPSVVETADESRSLPQRLAAYTRSVHRHAPEAEVVDAHFALFAVLPVIARRLRHRPLVVHFHGPWAEESRSQNPASRVSSWVKKRVEVSVYRRSKAVVTLSRAFADLVTSSYGVAARQVYVIPPGVDLERFTPDRDGARERLGIDRTSRVVFTARRLVPRMGLDVLLEAWTQVRDNKAVLLIAGDGPLRPDLERRAVELGIGARVRFLGRVSEEDLVDHYRSSDVSVVPTTELEGFGLVVLEALACGTPVVVTDVGGLPEALAGLDASLVVPPGEVAPLAERLRKALTGDVPPAAECRRHAERFTWDRAVDTHQALYTDVLRRHGVDPSQPRTVVFLDHSARLSGGEIALLRTVQGLSERWAPKVLLGEHGDLEDHLRAAGIAVSVLPMDERTGSLRRTELLNPMKAATAVVQTGRYVRRLSAQLVAEEAAVVHANSLKSGIYGGLAARIARVPMLWHVRDRLATDYMPAPVALFVRAALRTLPTTVVANSRTTAETLGKTLARRSAVVHDPYSPQQPPVARAHVPGRPLRIGMVGRISPWKGQDVFIDALALLGESDVEAQIVGSPMFGDDETLQELEAQVQRLGLSDRVRFTGFTTDVEAVLAEFDVLVHASTLPEPFGQVVVEGMAAGRAVIAADAGGPAEIVTDGVDGLLHPPGDAAALARALIRLVEDPALRVSLGEAALARARDFLPDIVVPDFERVLDRTLGDSR